MKSCFLLTARVDVKGLTGTLFFFFSIFLEKKGLFLPKESLYILVN